MTDQDRIKLEAELSEAKAQPGPVQAYQEIDRLRADLAVARKRVRQIKAALPSTYYSDRDPATRVRFMVEQWQRAVTANQQLEAEVDEAKAENARLAAALKSAHSDRMELASEVFVLAKDLGKTPSELFGVGTCSASTALRDLLGPVVNTLERLDHYQAGAGMIPSRKEVNDLLTRLRALVERKP